MSRNFTLPSWNSTKTQSNNWYRYRISRKPLWLPGFSYVQEKKSCASFGITSHRLHRPRITIFPERYQRNSRAGAVKTVEDIGCGIISFANFPNSVHQRHCVYRLLIFAVFCFEPHFAMRIDFRQLFSKISGPVFSASAFFCIVLASLYHF